MCAQRRTRPPEGTKLSSSPSKCAGRSRSSSARAWGMVGTASATCGRPAHFGLMLPARIGGATEGLRQRDSARATPLDTIVTAARSACGRSDVLAAFRPARFSTYALHCARCVHTLLAERALLQPQPAFPGRPSRCYPAIRVPSHRPGHGQPSHTNPYHLSFSIPDSRERERTATFPQADRAFLLSPPTSLTEENGRSRSFALPGIHSVGRLPQHFCSMSLPNVA